MNNAKAVNLRVRPLQSVDLSFPVDGIIGRQSDIHLLGKTVAAFDLAHFYSLLGTVVAPTVWVRGITDPAHGVFSAGKHVSLPDSLQPLGWGKLKYDSGTILNEMGGSILFALRSEHIKAALDKAVGQRENVWAQRYESVVYHATLKAYDRDDPDSKLSRLERLTKISKTQHDRLSEEYHDFDGSYNTDVYKNGVIKQSITNSGLNTYPVRTTSQGGATIQDWVTNPNTKINVQVSSQLTRGFEYRHPSLENDAQFERAQASLLDEKLTAVSATNYVWGSQVERENTDPFHQAALSKRYLANDLRAIDLDVRRLQVAYMDTILVSPIKGIVTGVFRNLGDSVRAAQPVVRVEDDSEIYLVGTLKCRALISIGQSVTVTTSLFDTSQAVTIAGEVAAVRGHDSENELWDVLIRCSNRDGAGLPLLPINYNFSFESTVISFA